MNKIDEFKLYLGFLLLFIIVIILGFVSVTFETYFKHKEKMAEINSQSTQSVELKSPVVELGAPSNKPKENW